MITVIACLTLAFCFERAHMVIAAPNYGSAWNGFGAIELTAQRKNKAPMAYRVLMPLLVTGTEKLFHLPTTRRLDVYQVWKIILTGLAFWSVTQAWSLTVAAVTAVLMLLTIRFDYWSYAPELAGVALAMTGTPVLAILGAVLFALSRETAPITAVIYYLVTGDPIGAAKVGAVAVLTMLLVRSKVGRRANYTGLWKLGENLKRYAQRDPETGRLIFFLYQPFFYSDIFIAAAITAGALAAVLAGATGGPAVIVLLGACWAMSLTDETRVFTPVLPWIAALITGGF